MCFKAKFKGTEERGFKPLSTSSLKKREPREKNMSNITTEQKRFWSPDVRELEPYVPGEQPKIQNLLKLNTNENPYPPSPKAIKAGKERLKSLNLYSDPTGAELRLTLATYHGLNPENVVLGNGSDECLSLLFAGFTDNLSLIHI